MVCMACADATCDFKAMALQRRPVGEYDVLINMKYCGVCHSNLHHAADQSLKPTVYPCVPGHELAGVAVAIGSKVTTVKVGMQVGVGCYIDSCMDCPQCHIGEENKCKQRVLLTYQSEDKGSQSGRAETYPTGGVTAGGYTNRMVVHERFAIKIPDDYPLECAGPIMCAGITMSDPLKKHGVGSGTRVGIVGLGGLGQVGVKLAKALGCIVVAISRSEAKRNFAVQCGAHTFLASANKAEMKAPHSQHHSKLP